MSEFFEVVSLQEARALSGRFGVTEVDTVGLGEARGRVLAADVVAPADLPGFARSTMDGYAVRAASTFGASDSAPGVVRLVGAVEMGTAAEGTVGRGEAASILTGGMLPAGADAVIMVEHSEALDDTTVELTRAVAPGQNVIAADEDVAAGTVALTAGARLGPADIGLLAALGITSIPVHRRPRVAILSTGDEVIPADREPGPGEVRDVNSWTLAAQVDAAGGDPVHLGIVSDDFDALLTAARAAIEDADMVLLSGGSSVGTRDLTIDVIRELTDSEVLVHGVSIKPGKPTILARVGDRPFWGLPGHVGSAMVVFELLVRGFVEHAAGLSGPVGGARLTDATLSRNVPSRHGRTEFVPVRLERREEQTWALPVLGRSGLVRPLVQAAGLMEIPRDTEGLDVGARVLVRLLT